MCDTRAESVVKNNSFMIKVLAAIQKYDANHQVFWSFRFYMRKEPVYAMKCGYYYYNGKLTRCERYVAARLSIIRTSTVRMTGAMGDRKKFRRCIVRCEFSRVRV